MEGYETFFGFAPTLTKEDSSNFILTGANAAPLDSVNVNGGVLALADGASLDVSGGNTLIIGSGGAFAAYGNADVTGDVSLQEGGYLLLGNGGPFDPIAALNDPNDHLTVTGDFFGGGSLWFDVYLGDSTSEADLLTINQSVYGNSLVYINNTGGPGASTDDGNGILIIEVLEGKTDEDDFALGRPVVVGTWQYELVLDEDGQNWYLRSFERASSGYFYPVLPDAAATLGRDLIGTLWERVGMREGAEVAGETIAGLGVTRHGAWLRGGGAWIDGEGSLYTSGDHSVFASNYDTTQWFLQGGIDAELAGDGANFLIGSLFGHWGSADTSADALDATGTLDMDGYGGGGSLTWYGADGFYADLVGLITAYSTQLSASDLGALGDPDGTGYAASFEIGKEYGVAPGLSLVPQGQLVYQRIDLDEFTDEFGNAVAWNDTDSLEGRLGLAAKAAAAIDTAMAAAWYGDVNIVHEFLDPAQVTVGPDSVRYDTAATGFEFGGGVNLFNQDGPVTSTLFADADYRIPVAGEGATIFKARAGIRVNF